MTPRDGAILLGVESSCDEAACALVRDGREVLANAVASQIDLHTRYGGVVPEIASRAHVEQINAVIAEALRSAGVGPEDIFAVAVTHQPGLIGSLLVGLTAAKTLAWIWDAPLVGVNHVYAHAYAPALDGEPIDYPAVALVASGGHTALYRCKSPTDMTLLGTTIDDAAGEAFDKVASILQLGYPGGPAIDRAAKDGDPKAVNFPRTLLKGRSLDFSFSGIKTAVLYHVNGVPGVKYDHPRGLEHFSRREIRDVAASFQQAVVDVLATKIRRAVENTGAGTILLGGGVAANSALRAAAEALAKKLNCTLRCPPLKYCTDNAAMIAALGWHYLRAGRTADLHLAATATVRR
ncbi:MAG: tRNA (adenosine(37)-N6)-threonylcarbamoyltransferase complex transferase subunit TsaD [Phycisphaerae bacterium]|nr:tRNA (adenosine(37)-N6)-threonylcarbamoyltransferase complex transferase subunit TsaD [Phycisphaerae bacterium]